MKRLFVVASLAIMAVACQKEEVRNEVLTPIGFNTETGKQTRAIQPTNDGYTDNFGVFSYLYNAGEAGQLVMNNQKVTSQGQTVDNNGDAVAYYWPNDPDNHLNFYAYSPFNVGNVSMATEGTLKLTDYVHTNYSGTAAVDFMVATAVTNAKFAGEYTVGTTKKTYGEGVPTVFHHEMTQVIFKVKTSFTGGTITLKSITLKDIVNKATYEGTNAAIGQLSNWTPAATGGTGTYVLEIPNETVTSDGVTTTEVTMIPQTLAAQNFTITYEININNVVEKVSKDFTFAAATDAIAAWEPNKKVTYTLAVGLNSISFIPSVDSWDDQAGSYSF